jgi:hypothetical protein
MNKLRFALLLVTACTATNGFAGWISGGTGELRGDSGNPWFLNIPEQAGSISYCIDADEIAMGVSRPDLIAAVDAALYYWQVQLPSAYLPSSDHTPKVQVKVGPFQFVDQPCTDSIDVAFQFGKVSTPNQIKFVSDQHIDLRHFVGFAARLTYDRKLKGSGFIYIAPETGPLRPIGEDIKDKFWSSDIPHNNRLQAILAHELGHIFGIAHFGDSDHLMGQDFPEALISEYLALGTIKWKYRNIFRAGDQTYFDNCFSGAIPTNLAEIFGLKPEERCLKIRLTGDGLLAYAYESKYFPLRLAARMSIDSNSWRERYHDVARLWLPEDRTIFNSVPSYIKALSGPSVVETMVAGTIVTHSLPSPRSHPAVLTVDPSHFQLGVYIDGKMNPDVFDGAKSLWAKPSVKKKIN